MTRLLKALGFVALIIVGAPLFIAWKIVEGLAIFALGLGSLAAIVAIIEHLAR